MVDIGAAIYIFFPSAFSIGHWCFCFEPSRLVSPPLFLFFVSHSLINQTLHLINKLFASVDIMVAWLHNYSHQLFVLGLKLFNLLLLSLIVLLELFYPPHQVLHWCWLFVGLEIGSRVRKGCVSVSCVDWLNSWEGSFHTKYLTNKFTDNLRAIIDE